MAGNVGFNGKISSHQKSVHKRFVRWAHSGVWERIFHELVRDRKNQYLMIDSTLVRAHQQAATGDKALGRSRGGLTTKVHLLVNELGMPLEFLITAGQISDSTPAVGLLGARSTEAVIADKGYDSDVIVKHIQTKMQAKAVIQPRPPEGWRSADIGLLIRHQLTTGNPHCEFRMSCIDDVRGVCREDRTRFGIRPSR